jgi:Skp family chaperone for outer membrane proteins
VNAINSVFDLVKDAEVSAASLTAQARDTISAERKAMQGELDKLSAAKEEALSALQADLSRREKALTEQSDAELDREWTAERLLLDEKYKKTSDGVRTVLKGKVLAKNGDS